MPSIAPLSAQQIADLFGALDELVGTGDNVTAAYQLDFFPVVHSLSITDHLLGKGDGVATAYQTHRFPIQPSGVEVSPSVFVDVDLRVGTINGTALAAPADFSVNLATGAITLTASGVLALGTAELHARYVVASTVELRKGPTFASGTPLTEGVDYILIPQTGKIVLTTAGIASLGTAQLRAKYQAESGLVNVLTEANGSLRSSNAQTAITEDILIDKDQSVRFVHEQIEQKAILHVEAERRALQNASAILFTETGNFVTATQQVTEAKIVASVDAPYTNLDPNVLPLYFKPDAASEIPGDPSNPRHPDGGLPRFPVGLTGGTGSDAANEQNQISVEQAQYGAIIAAGTDAPGPIGWTARFLSPATTTMLSAISAQQTALTTQIAAITAFLADNPVPNDHISAANIADATAAQAAASARFAANAAYVTSVTTAPHAGLANAEIGPTGTRNLASTARTTFITGTRKPQIDALLGTPLVGLYLRRFFWITMRASIGTGTLFNALSAQKSQVTNAATIATNSSRIDEILLILGSQ